MKKRFKISMLKVEVLVLFCETSEEADTLGIKHLQIDRFSDDSSTMAAFCAVNYRRCVIWIGPMAKRSQVFHECYHATCRILREINASGTDEELNAHLCEFITEKTFAAWEEHQKEKR